MKHLIHFMIVSSLALFSHNALAKIWIVDSNPGNHAKDFATLQAAHDNVNVLSGDTLYLSGFTIDYGSLTATKQLHIFGPGYYLSENDSTQANIHSASIGSIILNNGSAGFEIMGCTMSTAYVNANNITIERNYIGALIIQNNASNIIISQNIIGYPYLATYSIWFQGNNNNIFIMNNYIGSNIDGANYSIYSSSSTNTIIALENNVIRWKTTISNANIFNNILYDGLYDGTNNDVRNNICNGTQFSITGNNQQNVNMANVFVGTGSSDGQWELKEGSPAIGTGTNGTDIGMFGGDNPYVLSGIPPIPTIYYFLGSSVGSQSLPVQIKIKSRR